MWIIEDTNVREVDDSEVRPTHTGGQVPASYWYGNARSPVMLLKGVTIFDNEDDALLRLLGEMQSQRDNLNQSIETLRRRYKKIIKPKLRIT